MESGEGKKIPHINNQNRNMLVNINTINSNSLKYLKDTMGTTNSLDTSNFKI